jgi:hypothetical protein
MGRTEKVSSVSGTAAAEKEKKEDPTVVKFLKVIDLLLRVDNPEMRLGATKPDYMSKPTPARLGEIPISVSVSGIYVNGLIQLGGIHVSGEIKGKQINPTRGLRRNEKPDKKTLKRRMDLLRGIVRAFEDRPDFPAEAVSKIDEILGVKKRPPKLGKKNSKILK